jgi:hypothetical protein
MALRDGPGEPGHRRHDGTGRFSEHRLTIPLADAILGGMLMDRFEDHRLDQIVESMLDCKAADALADGAFEQWRDLTGRHHDQLEAGAFERRCLEVIGDIVCELRAQVETAFGSFRWDQRVTLAGQTWIKLLPDGSRIARLGGGWTDLGTFSGRL